MVKLRDYQEAMLRACVQLAEAHNYTQLKTVMFSAPTGTGKGSAQLAILDELRKHGFETLIVTPSLEIVRGFLERIGVDTDVGSGTLAKRGQAAHIYTPTALMNRVLAGSIEPPQVILRDEAHEDALGNVTTDTLTAALGGVLSVGFTATPYRATPKSTRSLRELYGEPIVALTIERAVENGWMALPEFVIEPICNDDIVKIQGNDFSVSSVHEAYTNEIDKLGQTIDDHWTYAPTIVSLTSKKLMHAVSNELKLRGIPHHSIDAKTSGTARSEAYIANRERGEVILQIGVLTRGADLWWARQLIDAQPTMSPVRFMQTVGRVCRPGDQPSRVICTNRNLARFSYLFEGMIPREEIIAEQVAFGAPCVRSHARTLGFEEIGRFKPAHLALTSGGHATCYIVDSPNENGLIETFGFMFFPGSDTPLVAKRHREAIPGETNEYGAPKMKYSKWRRCEMPAELVGFKSHSKRPLSPGQVQWYKRAAGRCGICEMPGNMDNRKFQAFTLVNDLRKG